MAELKNIKSLSWKIQLNRNFWWSKWGKEKGTIKIYHIQNEKKDIMSNMKILNYSKEVQFANACKKI